MIGIMSFFSLLIMLAVPVAVILLLYWVYNIYINSKIQTEQLRRLIELLEKKNTNGPI